MRRQNFRFKVPPVEPTTPTLFGPARFRWLVDFAQQASGPIDAGAERQLIRTLAVCLQGVTVRRDSGEVIDLCAPTRRAPTAGLPLRRDDDQKAVEEKLALIRVTIHTLLTRFLSGVAGETGLQAVVTLRRTADGEGLIRDAPEADDVRNALAYILLEDIEKYGRFLRRCPASKCGRLFVRERRQRYCSDTCRNRATFQAWYRRHKQAKAGQQPGTAKKSLSKRGPRPPK